MAIGDGIDEPTNLDAGRPLELVMLAGVNEAMINFHTNFIIFGLSVAKRYRQVLEGS